MTYKEIQEIFNALGLSTIEQREKIQSQGVPNIFTLTSERKSEFQINTWSSNQSIYISKGGKNIAQLE